MLAPLSGSLGPLGRARGVPNGLLNNLVTHWRMEEASGIRVDATGRGNDLTPGNAPGNAAGILGNAVALNGTNQTLARASTADLAPGNTAFTVACWVYVTSGIAAAYIIEKGDASVPATGYEYGLRTRPTFAAGSQYELLIGGSADNLARVQAGTMAFNTWHMLVGWFNPATSRIGLSFNGAAAITTASTTAPSNTGLNFIVGATWSAGALLLGSSQLAGRVDSVSFWKGRALSDTDITALYNGGAGLNL